MTAKSKDAIKATVGLNLLSHILYTKKVSNTARIPIINLDIANAVSIDEESGAVFKNWG